MNWNDILLVGVLHLDGKSGSIIAFSSATHSKPGLHFPQSPEIVLQAPHVSPSSLNSGSTFRYDKMKKPDIYNYTPGKNMFYWHAKCNK